jgi:hypothetical protein
MKYCNNIDESLDDDTNSINERKLEHLFLLMKKIFKCLENEIATTDRQAYDNMLQITSLEQNCRVELHQCIAAPS